jgi:aspartate carbamoyltransferase regulatory subunit
MGKKDIMKIECPIDFMDLDILGFIDHNITVNIIENKQIVAKKQLTLPKEIRNVIRCKNPRCITSIEQELDHVFVLTDEENQIYRCKYCEEKHRRQR